MNRRSLLGGAALAATTALVDPSIQGISRPAPQAATLPCRGSPL